MKIRYVLAAVVLALFALGLSTPAPAMTCNVEDPALNSVVCQTVLRAVTPVLAPLCTGKLHACLGVASAPR